MPYGNYDLLAELKAYKVRPAEDHPPDKFEPDTKNHEGIAGTLGALEYLVCIGTTFGSAYAEKYHEPASNTRRRYLLQAMAAIRTYGFEISRTLLEIITGIPAVRLYGPSDPGRLEQRVPTFAITIDGWHPRKVAQRLGERGIYVWDGNYYALAVTERLGLENSGGMIRNRTGSI